MVEGVPHQCGNCDGTGRVPCRVCGALGVVVSDASDPNHIRTATCPMCKGLTKQKCPLCHGAGELIYPY